MAKQRIEQNSGDRAVSQEVEPGIAADVGLMPSDTSGITEGPFISPSMREEMGAGIDETAQPETHLDGLTGPGDIEPEVEPDLAGYLRRRRKAEAIGATVVGIAVIGGTAGLVYIMNRKKSH